MSEQYAFKMTYDDGSSSTYFMQTPPPDDSFFKEIYQHCMRKEFVSSLPSLELIDKIKYISAFKEKDKKYWDLIVSDMATQFIYYRMRPICGRMKLTRDKKTQIKAFMYFFVNDISTLSLFTFLFSQHGNLEMLKWMKNSNLIKIYSTHSYKHISATCLYNCLEISIIEGHLKTAIWFNKNFNLKINYEDTIFGCCLTDNHPFNISIIKKVSDKVFSEGEIEKYAKDISEYYGRVYIIDKEKQYNRIYKELKENLKTETLDDFIICI